MKCVHWGWWNDRWVMEVDDWVMEEGSGWDDCDREGNRVLELESG